MIAMETIKPKRLQKGDKVAIVSPSYAEAKTMPNRLNQSLVFLKSLGLEPVLMPHALGQSKELPYLSASAKERASDINLAFANPSIKAIFCTVGGENCNGLLPFLDFELIKNNPKIFMGFSDITVLLLAIHQKTGLVTFHGPNILYSFGAAQKVPIYTKNSLKEVLFDGNKDLVYQPADYFSDISFLSDDVVLDEEHFVKKQASWEFVKRGEARGLLLGGNLESLEYLRGTEYWSDFQEKLLFWEEIDEDVSSIHQWLINLSLSGAFAKIKGMIVGKIADKTDKWDQRVFFKMLIEVTKDYDFPVLSEVDLGHTRPMLTLPIGVEAKINLNGTIELLEEAVL